MFIKLDWIDPLIRRRYRELERFDTGQDERRARDELRPRTGEVESSTRDNGILASLERENDHFRRHYFGETNSGRAARTAARPTGR